jgi:HD-GYP domain-containing protein (c-di-GMP phosphodiesterase class II)
MLCLFDILSARGQQNMGQPHIVLHGAGQSWDAERRLAIGRMPSCEVFLDDASVSRRHAEVFFTEAGWVVRDLGSTNGTFLNGTRLGAATQRLRTGDHLQPGKVVLSVESLEEEDAASGAPFQDPTCVEGPALGGAASASAAQGVPAEYALASGPGATLLGGADGVQLPLDRQRACFMQALAAVAAAVDCRDPMTAGHAQRVTEYVLLLAAAVKVSPADYHYLQTVTPLHDIGKVCVAEAILCKPGRLTPAEHAEIRAHPARGADFLAALPELANALPIVRSHHEHWDGTGYPDGLIAEAISYLARMVALADVFDALTSDRSYRRALTVAEACGYIEKNSGSLFDPAYVPVFLRLRPRLERMVCARSAPPPTLNRKELDRLRESLQHEDIGRLVRPE